MQSSLSLSLYLSLSRSRARSLSLSLSLSFALALSHMESSLSLTPSLSLSLPPSRTLSDGRHATWSDAQGVSHPVIGRMGEREFFIDNLLVRSHFIIVMIKWTGLAP